MDSIKISNSGDSQLLHLPEAYQFDCEEVYIKKTFAGVLLMPKENNIWDVWGNNLNKYNESFMIDRNQPEP